MTQTDWPAHEVARVRIELAHGVVQLLCRAAGVDALHIKGLALDESLQHTGRASMDVDLLVRPRHIDRLRAALREHGWEQTGRFATSSPFEHAQNWRHRTLGHLDLHRLIPGIGLPAEEAFETFWRARRSTRLARVECAVPGLDAQALVVLLHAARSHGDQRSTSDVDHVWREAGETEQQRIRELVAVMRAEVAFAAAVGGLEDYRDRPDYLLWKVNSTPDAPRTTEWRARIRATPGRRRKVELAVRSLLVNRDHLRAVSDHEPSRSELAREFLRRAAVAARELRNRSRR